MTDFVATFNETEGTETAFEATFAESNQTIESDFGETIVIAIGSETEHPVYIEVRTTDDGVVITATDVNGTTSAIIKNGSDGKDGTNGIGIKSIRIVEVT